MFNDGFDDHMVRQRSGHRSTSLNTYKHPGESLLHSISYSLQPPKPKYSSSTITKKTVTVLTLFFNFYYVVFVMISLY